MAQTDNKLRGVKFPILAIILQIIFIILFAVFGEYDDSANPKNDDSFNHPERNDIYRYSGVFMDVHVMIFIGFGFLMTFLKRYGYSAVSFNLFIAALVIQWSIIVKGFVHTEGKSIHVGIKDMIGGNFAAAVVLISFGAVLGKVSPTQLIVMAMIEVPLLVVNEYIGVDLFKVVDIGGSMFIHAFGAYFGIAVSRIIYKRHQVEDPKEGAIYHSDLFAMIGTVFLWMFWPSFNGALGVGDDQHRAFVNTYFSLAGCAISAIAFSMLLSHDRKLDMVHVQNATIAGGVAIGSMADLNVHLYGALLVGVVAGFLSVVGYRFITPVLCDKLKVHDTCGVNNLHGMPGIMSAIGASIACSVAHFDNYGAGLYNLFPQRAPNGTFGLDEADPTRRLMELGHVKNGEDRSASEQAWYQIAALGVTLALAIAGGLLAGIVMAIPIWDPPKSPDVYNDETNWEVAPEWASNSYTIVREIGEGDQQVLEMTLASNGEKAHL